MMQFSNGESPVGALCARLPSFVRNPPIETVVFAWGVNEDGQLGLDLVQNHVSTPKVVEAMLGIPLSGRRFGQPPIVAGSRNTMAIDADGGVWSWGWNDRGTLGHGHRGQEHKPKHIVALRGVKVKQVAVNGWHALALSDTGQVYAWGGNEYLQCAADPEKRDIVSPMVCVPQIKVTMIACGGMHSLALTETGEVWTWGEPWGDFSLKVERKPRPVRGATGMAAIACGAFHNMALSRAGQVYTWGTNDYGQLGNGNTSYQIEPKIVLGMKDVLISDIGAGGWHSLALSINGEVWTWGRGEYGRLGIGDKAGSSKLRPKKITGLEGHFVVQVGAGGTHTMVLTADSRMFIWGRGSFGRLGVGEKDQYSPVECHLPGGTERWRVISIACGGRHSLALAMPVRQQDEPQEGEAASSASERASADREGALQLTPTSHISKIPTHGSFAFNEREMAEVAAAAQAAAQQLPSNGSAAQPAAGAAAAAAPAAAAPVGNGGAPASPHSSHAIESPFQSQLLATAPPAATAPAAAPPPQPAAAAAGAAPQVPELPGVHVPAEHTAAAPEVAPIASALPPVNPNGASDGMPNGFSPMQQIRLESLLSSELAAEIGGINQEPDSEDDKGIETGIEGDSEREEREDREARRMGAVGDSDAHEDVQGDSDDEGAFRGHGMGATAMALANMTRPMSPGAGKWGLGGLPPGGEAVMSPRMMGRHMAPGSPMNASTSHSFAGAL